MTIEVQQLRGRAVAVVSEGEKLLSSAQSALDLIMSARYESGASLIAVDKRCVDEAFFILSSGVAGEVLQKFINYRAKLAIFGDYSRYTSKPLRDFIYESNRGRDVFFLSTREEAVEALAGAAERDG